MSIIWCSYLLTITLICISGQSLESNKTRIIGGHRAQKPIPYQISLQVKIQRSSYPIPFITEDGEWSHNCGGSIIGEYHVLTAAHCVDGFNASRLSVLAGTSKRTKGGSRHMIESIVIHEDYKELETCDIAIMKMKTPFVFGPTINKIDFTDETLIEGGVHVKLSGWGYTNPIRVGWLPEDLQTIDLRTLTNEQCQKEYEQLTDYEICTLKTVLQGACAGDSGGPLVNTDRTKQIGVVSYGTGICSIGFPDVFTRVSLFVDWINEQMK